MLKYVDTKVTFSEVPDEITLCINISGCKIGCKGCHSSYLAEDIGKPLYISVLSQLIAENKGITCVSFMGGDSDPFEVNVLAGAVKSNTDLKTAWYSGRQELAGEINLNNFDFIKLGPYIKESGSLTDRTTNQRFYKVYNNNLIDMTDRFFK